MNRIDKKLARQSLSAAKAEVTRATQALLVFGVNAGRFPEDAAALTSACEDVLQAYAAADKAAQEFRDARDKLTTVSSLDPQVIRAGQRMGKLPGRDPMDFLQLYIEAERSTYMILRGWTERLRIATAALTKRYAELDSAELRAQMRAPSPFHVDAKEEKRFARAAAHAKADAEAALAEFERLAHVAEVNATQAQRRYDPTEDERVTALRDEADAQRRSAAQARLADLRAQVAVLMEMGF